MLLEEYSDVKEKEPFFKNGGTVINVNIDKIFDKIGEMEAQDGSFIFRGSSEAKHRLYCSSQRLYMNQELHRQVPSDSISEHYALFISSLIEECKGWNNGVIRKLLVQSGINENNSIAYLSYMQHFGVPTPFLDFTFNPYVALFFAIDSINYTPSDREIDNYFSFYYTYKENTVFESWQYVFDKNLEKENISYESIDRNCMSIILPEKELYKIINSVNIINQQGLFFYNNHPWYPLERTYKDHVNFTIKKLGREKFDELLMLDTVAGCFNIHKSLVPAIRERLAKKGITRSYIYPEMSDFRSTVINSGILKVLTLKKDK